MTAALFIALATAPVALLSWMWFRFVTAKIEHDLTVQPEPRLDHSCNDL